MHRQDPDLLTAAANIERQICDQYGRMGLWSMAAEYPKRNMRHGRMIDLVWDSRFSPTILVEGSMEDYARYFQQYDRYRRTSLAGQSDENQKLGHLVWACALWEKPPIDLQEFIALGQRALTSVENHPWWELPQALLQCRAGDVSGADQTYFRGYSRDVHVTSLAISHSYFEAMLESALEHPELAQAQLQDAESLYSRICRASLIANPPQPPGHLGKYWWELVYADQLRQQAWKAIHGTFPPHSAWPHLLESRGYRLIGENEKADAELAAAVAAAGDDPEIWMASAKLRSEAGDPQHLVEADWERSLELAADDPLTWIHRGRWYAEQGEHEKADADFAQAAALTPNELNRFLEAGWWAAGPLSSDWEPSSVTNLEPDPSQPLPPTGRADVKNALAWQSLQPDGMGRLQFPDQLAKQGTSSVLLMTYVYSPDPRVATLRSNKRANYQVWINGEMAPTVEPSISASGLRNFFLTPLSLQHGGLLNRLNP